MTAILGIALLLLVVGIWAYAERHGLDPFGEDDDDSGYVDPARPRLAPPPSQTARSQALHPVAGHADRGAALGAHQESGLLTTTLRRVK